MPNFWKMIITFCAMRNNGQLIDCLIRLIRKYCSKLEKRPGTPNQLVRNFILL